MQEIWKEIPGHEGYYSISNLGQIRRDKRGNGTQIGRILKDRKDKDGYRVIQLTKNGISKTFKIHLLVLLAFIGPRPKGKMTNHKKGIKWDNRLSELEYVTQSENQRHSYDVLGNKGPYGEKNHFSRLKKETVIAIFNTAIEKNYSHATVAKIFNVSRETVSQIVRGSRWKHLNLLLLHRSP